MDTNTHKGSNARGSTIGTKHAALMLNGMNLALCAPQPCTIVANEFTHDGFASFTMLAPKQRALAAHGHELPRGHGTARTRRYKVHGWRNHHSRSCKSVSRLQVQNAVNSTQNGGLPDPLLVDEEALARVVRCNQSVSHNLFSDAAPQHVLSFAPRQRRSDNGRPWRTTHLSHNRDAQIVVVLAKLGGAIAAQHLQVTRRHPSNAALGTPRFLYRC